MIPSWFEVYFQIGFDHITDVKGIDHMLFLLVISCAYSIQNWKTLFLIITAFTFGHTISTGISLLGIPEEVLGWVEWFIPLSILLSSFLNLRVKKTKNEGQLFSVIAILFGLLHGLGFGSFFNMLMAMPGSEWKYFIPFTLGIEVGQTLVVFAVLSVSFICINTNLLKQRDWIVLISGVGIGLSFQMLIERWPI